LIVKIAASKQKAWRRTQDHRASL